jgi:amino acid transporter
MPSVATQHPESESASALASNVEVGQVDSGVQDYGWERGLSPRAVIMLSLGGGIGLGLWIGTGTALSAGQSLPLVFV